MSNPPSNFDEYIKLLLQTALKIPDQLYNVQVSKSWIKWTNKFFNTYNKANKPSAFENMFLEFYNENEEFLDKPIFYDTDEESDLVNDELFRRTDIITTEDGEVEKKKSSSSWKSKETGCKGHIIYFAKGKKGLHAISVPISEIYQASLELFTKKNESSTLANAGPSVILMCLYGIFSQIVENPSKNVKDNLDTLTEYVTDVGFFKNKDDNLGLSGITSIISSLMKQNGLSANLDASQLEGTLNNVMNNDLFASVGKVVQKIASDVSAAGEDGKPKDIPSILNSLGQAIQNKDVVDMIADTAKKTTNMINSLPGMDTNKNTASIEPESTMDASEQD